MFDLFDFWDGRDGFVDGAKVGDLLRCCGLNPTNTIVNKNGGTKKFGMTTYTCSLVAPSFFQLSSAAFFASWS